MCDLHLNHDVEDVQRFAAGIGAMGRSAGATAVSLWLSIDSPRNVTVAMRFPTPAAATAAADDAGFVAGLRRAGAVGPIRIDVMAVWPGHQPTE